LTSSFDAWQYATSEPIRSAGRVTPALTGGPKADAPPCRRKHSDAEGFAPWKNPENLTDRQHVKLEWIAKTGPRPHRAYLLNEGLRTVFKLPADQASEALDNGFAWARRYRIESFVKLQRRVDGHRAQFLASIAHGLANGFIESANTKIDSSPAWPSASQTPTPSSP
jgi:transposase